MGRDTSQALRTHLHSAPAITHFSHSSFNAEENQCAAVLLASIASACSGIDMPLEDICMPLRPIHARKKHSVVTKECLCRVPC